MNQTIIYSCPFVPAEWIAAHGLNPSRIAPVMNHASNSGAAAGICPYTHAFIQSAVENQEASAIIVTTLCDQMRRAPEWIERECEQPVFLMNVPAAWGNENARRMYKDELIRLGRFLVQTGGAAPSKDDLVDTMRDYDAARTLLRNARASLSSRIYSEAIAAFHQKGVTEFPSLDGSINNNVIPIALLGSPLLPSHFHLFELVEVAGGPHRA